MAKKPEKTWDCKIEINAKLDEGFFESVLECMLSGCVYWADGDNGHTEDNMHCFTLLEQEASSDEGIKRADMNPAAVLLGIQRIMDPKFSVRQDIRETLMKAIANNDAGDIDDEVADIIAQAVVFNEIVYG